MRSLKGVARRTPAQLSESARKGVATRRQRAAGQVKP